VEFKRLAHSLLPVQFANNLLLIVFELTLATLVLRFIKRDASGADEETVCARRLQSDSPPPTAGSLNWKRFIIV
jgi:hypothetical protein